MLKGRIRVLVVEDDKAQQLLIQQALRGDADLTIVETEAEAQREILAHEFDLFLLDINLPDGNGFQILLFLRDQTLYRKAPVIFITSREDLESKVLGFSLGADDYILKPFQRLELRARVAARLRDLEHPTASGNSSSVRQIYGPFEFNLALQTVDYRDGSKVTNLELTPLEFRLLMYFCQHANAVRAREEILKGVWGEATNVTPRSVDTYVAALRRKLKPFEKMIRSVHGTGYRMILETSEDEKIKFAA